MAQTAERYRIGIFLIICWFVLNLATLPLSNIIQENPSFFYRPVQSFLLFLSIPIFFIWLTLGFIAGISTLVTSILYIILVFKDNICAWPIFLFMFMGYSASVIYKNKEHKKKILQIDLEKLDEELNLLREKIKCENKDNERLRSSLARLSRLRGVIEDFSLALSFEEVIRTIIANCSRLFKDANRILLYIVDTYRRELVLKGSKRIDSPYSIKVKKGDIFDRWVMKHRQPLIVEDICKDFRFSLENEVIDEGFNSLISAPLMSENRLLGVLRVDSRRKRIFNHSDLRFLDIISDLSSVTIRNSILYEKIKDLAIHDSLTGLYVKKFFMDRLKAEIHRALENNVDFSVLLIDLDDFKSYNDRYGHNTGDLILKHVARIIRFFICPQDTAARYGGEEFVVLLVHRGKKEACRIAEALRRKFWEKPFTLRRQIFNITLSIGIATCPLEAKSIDELLMLADNRLYKAKAKGKNRVCAD